MSGRETLPNDREWSGTLSNVQKDLMDIQVWLVGPTGCLGVVGRLSRLSESGGRHSQMSGSCLETLPDVPEGWKAISDVRHLSGGLPGCLGGLSDVRECSKGPPGCPEDPLGCPGVVGRPSRMSLRGGRIFCRGRKPSWLSGSCRRRPSQMSGSGRESISDVREALQDVR